MTITDHLFSVRSLTCAFQGRRSIAVGALLGLVMLSLSACAKEDTTAGTQLAAVTPVAAAASSPGVAADTGGQESGREAAEQKAVKAVEQQESQAQTPSAAATNDVSAQAVQLSGAPATGAPAIEGKEYLVLKKPLATNASAGKVEVLGFFWYRCPHCRDFEPQLDEWAQQMGDAIVFKRVPVFFGRSGMEEEQRLYYTLEAMGLTDSMHEKIFTAVHSGRVDLTSQKKMADWLEAQGVDRAAFDKTFASFGVNTRVKQAQKIQNQYMVDGVPAVAVGGRYYTSPAIAGSIPRALEVSSQLVKKAR